MADVLLDLMRQLQSKQEKLTPQETKVLLSCKANIYKGFTVGAVVGSGLTWIATQRLNRFLRINLSIGAAGFAGIWGVRSSLHSCIDQILAWEGSRMQNELVSVIVERFPNDRRRMQLLSKHFYSERVYDDSTADQLKLRWRNRNTCVDIAANNERTPESDDHSDSDSKQNDSESKQVPMNSGISFVADPFDCIFGDSATGEESHHPDTASVRPRVLHRSHKRSHRRRRLRQQDVSQTLNS